MRHKFTFILIIACFSTLFLLCYAPVFLGDRQFGFRDAAHYYYPLYQRVQQEWNAVRWPLWEPEENAGVPLVGNPTAAVFYPGKLVFAVLPYAWGMRVYVTAHTVLAFATMLVLMRSWGTSWVGSALSALGYTMGGPVLFQNCNVIYLVGAAWLPLGMHAVDHWVRLGRRSGLIELAIVLAMQVLGGDPQSAYLLGLSGSAFAAGLARSRARGNQRVLLQEPSGARSGLRLALLLIAMVALAIGWCVVTTLLAMWLPKLRPPHRDPPTPPLAWMLWAPMAVNVTWGLAAIGFVVRWRRVNWRSSLGSMALGLAASAALALALTAVQLLPVIEFTQQTVRAAGGGPHDIYPFSIEPYRMVELLWPNFWGVQFQGNTFWAELVRIPGVYVKTWVPTLYLGGLTLVLALSALTLRGGPPWRVWLSAILVVSLLGSLGKYTSPIWAVRAVVATAKSPALNRLTADLGPVDTVDTTPIRQDGFLRDGDGSVYWWLSTFLPGFRQFRFPAKLFTFTSLALAALVGLGWDRLCAGRTHGISFLIAFLLLATLTVFAGVLIERQPILAAFGHASGMGSFGPFDAEGGYKAILLALVQAAVVLAAALTLTVLARKSPRLAGAVALIVTTADLAVANPRYVLTVPQSLLETKPKVLSIIEDAELARPAPGPFRIHRMPIWDPMGWLATRSPDRVQEIVSWERSTLQPKHGIELGVQFTHTIGVAELYDVEWYFSPFLRKVRTAEIARSLGVELGHEVVYFPRRGFDMWNTRYFVLPSYPGDWSDENRGFASFMFKTEQVYPELERFLGPNGSADYQKWVDTRDFRIERNHQEFPRAWVVHSVRPVEPLTGGLSRDSRVKPMLEILYAEDPLWYDPDMRAFDPHRVAWIDKDEMVEISGRLTGEPPLASETVNVTYPTPQRAVLEVDLKSPGVVILADVYYPGWALTIDDRPAKIYRVNRMMRGAFVPSGRHRLVYTFAPRSFVVGGVISIVGIVALALAALICVLRPVDHMVRGSNENDFQEVVCQVHDAILVEQE